MVVEPGEIDASEVFPVGVDDVRVVQVAVGTQQGMLQIGRAHV